MSDQSEPISELSFEAALKRVRTVIAEAETTFRMEQGPLLSLTRTYVAYPDKFRVDAKVSGATNCAAAGVIATSTAAPRSASRRTSATAL